MQQRLDSNPGPAAELTGRPVLYEKAYFQNYQTILGIISLLTSLFLENREYYIKYPYLVKYSASI